MRGRTRRHFVYTLLPSAVWTLVVLHSVCVRLFMDSGNREAFFVSTFREIATFAMPAVFAVNLRNFYEDWDAFFDTMRIVKFQVFGSMLLAFGSCCSVLASLAVPLFVLVSVGDRNSGWASSLVSMIVPQDIYGTYYLLGITCLILNFLADFIRFFGRISNRSRSNSN